MIDIHAHILPGIDDGARTLADSVEIVRWLSMQGVTDVIVTPHFVDETIYVSPRRDNLKLLKDLKEKIAEEGIKVNLYLGNEIYINSKIEELIKEKTISTMADSKYLLVELPINGRDAHHEDYLKDLIDKGYKVILAHPERYAFLQEDYGAAKELIEMGLLFQCNMRSILGKYGSGAKKTVKKMIKDGLVFTFSTDIHHVGRKNDIELAQKKLAKYYDEKELKKLLVSNPGKLLR